MRLRDAFENHGDKVHFFTVYIGEAHPTDGWALPVNRQAGIEYAQPTTTEARAAVAEICAVRLDMKMPMLLGDIENRVDMDYAARASVVVGWAYSMPAWRFTGSAQPSVGCASPI